MALMLELHPIQLSERELVLELVTERSSRPPGVYEGAVLNLAGAVPPSTCCVTT